MSKNKEYNGILKSIQKIIETKAKPCTIEQVLREYHTQNPRSMPYESLGYNSERDLLQNAKIFQINKINGKIYIQMSAEKNKSSVSETRLTRNIPSLRLWRDGSDDAIAVGDSIHKKELELLAKFNKMHIAAAPKNISTNDVNQEHKANKSLRKAKSAFTKDVPSVTKIRSAPIKMDVGKPSKNKIVNKSRSSMEKTVTSEQAAITKNRKSNSTILTKRVAGGKHTTPKKKSSLNVQRRRNYGNGDGKIVDVCDDDENDSNTDLHGSSSLTSIKFVDRLKNSLKPELNFLEWHLINILHTKVAAHPNGFLSERLPEWYAKTFDKPIQSDWWTLIVKSEKFDISTVDNKVKLKARYETDLPIQSAPKITKQGKTIDKNKEKISSVSSSGSSSSSSSRSLSLSSRSSRCSIISEMKYKFK